jgi:hypothetical protein
MSEKEKTALAPPLAEQSEVVRLDLESSAWGRRECPAPAGRRWDWKEWLGESWAEVALMLLLGVLLARISLAAGILSP